MARKHDMERRVKRQEETHQRIVELHKTVAMAPTVVRAISEKAGVERLTVYGHSPDERALFSACSGRYTAAYPPPDPASWTPLADPEERLRVTLTEATPTTGAPSR